jgi:hypothetical protein
MKTNLTILFLFCTVNAVAQSNAWKSSTNWTIYNIRSSRAFNYTLDSLHKFDSAKLDDSTMHSFIQDCKTIDAKDAPVWMGLYKTTCKFNDSLIHRIDISVYGAFFYDEETKTYFEITGERKEQWQDYLLHHLLSFPDKK